MKASQSVLTSISSSNQVRIEAYQYPTRPKITFFLEKRMVHKVFMTYMLSHSSYILGQKFHKVCEICQCCYLLFPSLMQVFPNLHVLLQLQLLMMCSLHIMHRLLVFISVSFKKFSYLYKYHPNQHTKLFPYVRKFLCTSFHTISLPHAKNL